VRVGLEMNACDCPKPHGKPVAGVGFSAFDLADVDDFAAVEPEKCAGSGSLP